MGLKDKITAIGNDVKCTYCDERKKTVLLLPPSGQEMVSVCRDCVCELLSYILEKGSNCSSDEYYGYGEGVTNKGILGPRVCSE